LPIDIGSEGRNQDKINERLEISIKSTSISENGKASIFKYLNLAAEPPKSVFAATLAVLNRTEDH